MSAPMPLFILTVIDGDLQDIMYMALYHTVWEDGRTVAKMADESPMALARSYEYPGADSTRLRFHLRTDARWSDGEPITAHDVVWTYQTMAEPDLPSPRRDYVEQLASVVAGDDSTVTFSFSRRYPEMLFHTGHAIVPRHVYDETPTAELQTHPSMLDPTRLVVSGAFRIGQWIRGQRIILEPNPYFSPRPYLDRIVVRVIPDEMTRLVELRNGAVHGIRVGSPANLALLRQASEEIRLQAIERRFSEFVAYNPEFEPFDNVEIRRALGLAIDVPAVIEALELSEHADVAVTAYSPIFANLHDPELSPLGYDPVRARRILNSQGWIDSDGDGVREKGGKPFRFALLLNSGNQRRADLATILQSYWRQIGVEAQPQQQEFQTFTSRLMEKEFEALIYGWQVSLSPDISGMWRSDAIYNFVSYTNPELQQLMDSALAQKTEEAAIPYWRAAGRLLARDQPYTWLYYMDQVVALRNELQGTEVDVVGMYRNVWEWWIPREQQVR